MKINRKIILNACLMTLLAYTNLSYAKTVKTQKCDKGTILFVAEDLNLSGIEESENKWNPYGLEGIGSAACKINPQNKNLMYVAIASNPINNSLNGFTYDFSIAIIDTKKNTIISSYKDQIDDDSGFRRIEEDTLWIDTANYKLNETIRAFGVELKNEYAPHCAEGGEGSIRTLYIQDDKQIRPILKDLTMFSWHHLVEGPDKCNSIAESVMPITENYLVNLSMAESRTNGFNDIIINMTSKVTDINNKEIKKINKDILPSGVLLKPFSYKVSYDGKEYKTKEIELMFYKWIERKLDTK